MNNERNAPTDCDPMFRKNPAGNKKQHRVSTNPFIIKNITESMYKLNKAIKYKQMSIAKFTLQKTRKKEERKRNQKKKDKTDQKSSVKLLESVKM